MGKGKIEVKKICNESARQVTFSKRKRGLFKKAQELAILCDAQVGVVLFSPAGKLFQFSSNSMQEIIERRAKHLQDASKLILPRGKQKYPTGQSESFHDETSKDTLDFRQMNGEDIGELTIDELHKLERRVKDRLFRVIEKKGEKMLDQVNNLHNVGQKLMVENALLKNRIELAPIRRGSLAAAAAEGLLTKAARESLWQMQPERAAAGDVDATMELTWQPQSHPHHQSPGRCHS